jgi:hypothetical protein
MKKKYEVNLSSEYAVTFPDEQKIIDYYIDGDWKETFYEFYGIEDMIRSIIYSFVRTGTQMLKDELGNYYFCKVIEGYPEFVRDDDNRDLYTSSHEECGTIIIERECELDVDFVTEQDNT